MHAMRISLSGALMAALLIFASGSPASAEQCDGAWVETPPGSGIRICVDSPGDPSGNEPVGDEGEGGLATCYDEGEQVPCVTDEGAWFESENCYGTQAQPQPPRSHPAWDGHDPSEGSLWTCTNTRFGSGGYYWFVPTDQVSLVDPAVLAQRALNRMPLEGAIARIAPSPEFHTYVHIENWLWLPEEQWHDLQETVSAGPTSVTVTAEPIRVDWSMGTGVTSCYDAGRVWQKGMTDAAKTSCSFVYESIENPAGDTHNVSARIVYGVTWVCSGACLSPSGDLGEIDAPAGEETTIEVRQRQTVVTQ